MRKFMVIALPLFAIVLFILVMLSGDFFKKPLGNDDDIPKTIEELLQIVQSEKWDEAGIKAKELDKIWKKIVNRVQFSSERDEINFFSMSIARLEGAILVKDKANAVMELKEAYEHWDQLGQ